MRLSSGEEYKQEDPLTNGTKRFEFLFDTLYLFS